VDKNGDFKALYVKVYMQVVQTARTCGWACQFATSGSTEAMGGSQNFVHGINREKIRRYMV